MDSQTNFRQEICEDGSFMKTSPSEDIKNNTTHTAAPLTNEPQTPDLLNEAETPGSTNEALTPPRLNEVTPAPPNEVQTPVSLNQAHIHTPPNEPQIPTPPNEPQIPASANEPPIPAPEEIDKNSEESQGLTTTTVSMNSDNVTGDNNKFNDESVTNGNGWFYLKVIFWSGLIGIGAFTIYKYPQLRAVFSKNKSQR